MPYSVSDSYFTAQQSREGSVVLAVLQSVLGYHVFSRGQFSTENLPTATPFQVGSGKLLDVSQLTSTLIPNITDIFASYTQTEARDCTVTLDAGDDDFASVLSTLSFKTAALDIVYGFLTVDYADMLNLFSGVVTREHFSADKKLTITGVRQ